MSVKSLSIRIDDKTLNKLHYVADYEARSANSQIIILIRDCIDEFEKENGEITIDKHEAKPICRQFLK
ncbi:MAG: hypothetical protein K2K57_00350 [Oscillospiraceae bacterium]|nr:hypothetical protein [Oscillospiraceae bacterium]